MEIQKQKITKMRINNNNKWNIITYGSNSNILTIN